MSFDPFSWTEKIIAFAVLLQTIELIQLRQTFADGGIWRWEILRDEFRIFPAPARLLLDWTLSYRNFVVLLWIRLCTAGIMLVYTHTMLSPLLLATTILICLRWRGTFNGGSDYMTIIVLAMLSVASAFARSPEVLLGCLWYIALQACLSYFVAGVVKLRRKNWRSGRALAGFLESATFELPGALSSAAENPRAAKLFSWGIIIFECCFPLALLRPGFALLFISAALLFHLINSYVFGLNRFLYAWSAAYPAVYFCSVLNFN